MMPQPPPRWAEKYLGIPFVLNASSMRGCDCVGLCQLVMQEQAKILVSRQDIYVGGLDELAPDTVKSRVGSPPWTTIVGTEQSKTFDWVLMWSIHKAHMAPLHVGIVSAPGWILHVQEDVPATQQKVKHLADRIILAVRHDALR